MTWFDAESLVRPGGFKSAEPPDVSAICGQLSSTPEVTVACPPFRSQQGNILNEMTRGIENSMAIAVFLTERCALLMRCCRAVCSCLQHLFAMENSLFTSPVVLRLPFWGSSRSVSAVLILTSD